MARVFKALDGATVNGPGPAFNIGGLGHRFSLQVFGSGYEGSFAVVWLEGSLDGVNWSRFPGGPGVTIGNLSTQGINGGAVLDSASSRGIVPPVRYVRANIVGLTDEVVELTAYIGVTQIEAVSLF